MKMSNKKVLITLSFVKNLIKQLNDPHAEDALKDSKQYCFEIPSGKQIFFRDLKLSGFAIRATRHSLVYTVEKKMPNAEPRIKATSRITTIITTVTHPPAAMAATSSLIPATIAFTALAVASAAAFIPVAVR